MRNRSSQVSSMRSDAWTVNIYPCSGAYSAEAIILIHAYPLESAGNLYVYIYFDGYPVVQRQAAPKVGAVYTRSWDLKVKPPAYPQYQAKGEHVITVTIKEFTVFYSKSFSYSVLDGAPPLE